MSEHCTLARELMSWAEMTVHTGTWQITENCIVFHVFSAGQWTGKKRWRSEWWCFEGTFYLLPCAREESLKKKNAKTQAELSSQFCTGFILVRRHAEKYQMRKHGYLSNAMQWNDRLTFQDLVWGEWTSVYRVPSWGNSSLVCTSAKTEWAGELSYFHTRYKKRKTQWFSPGKNSTCSSNVETPGFLVLHLSSEVCEFQEHQTDGLAHKEQSGNGRKPEPPVLLRKLVGVCCCGDGVHGAQSRLWQQQLFSICDRN